MKKWGKTRVRIATFISPDEEGRICPVREVQAGGRAAKTEI